MPDDISVEIEVVNNHLNGSSEVAIKEFQQKTKIYVSYSIQPVKNISRTRNLAVANSTGNYLFFTGDD